MRKVECNGKEKIMSNKLLAGWYMECYGQKWQQLENKGKEMKRVKYNWEKGNGNGKEEII